MKKTFKNELILSATALLGLFSAYLRHLMFTTGMDEKDLLIPGHPTTIVLWAVSLGFLAAAFFISQNQSTAAPFRAHFPQCKIRGGLSILGGALVCLYGVKEALGVQMPVGIFALGAGICMIFTGSCRLKGQHPSPMFHCGVCVFFIIRLVLSFQKWSSNPQLQDYVLQLMACISLMMFSFHRASCDANQINPKRTVFFSLCATFFCLASLSDQALFLFMLGAGLWSVGAAPTLEAPQQSEI